MVFDAVHYRDIVPRVSFGLKYTARPRANEVTITRLRLGHCRLNATLCHFDPHNDGLCKTCRAPKTVRHFLIYRDNVKLIKAIVTL